MLRIAVGLLGNLSGSQKEIVGTGLAEPLGVRIVAGRERVSKTTLQDEG